MNVPIIDAIKGAVTRSAAAVTPLSWTFEGAKPLIKILQAELRDIGYHVALGGGVLNKGVSKKDLDLYVLPMNNSSVYEDAREVLRRVLDFQGSIKDDPDYTGNRGLYLNSAMDEASVYSWKGKRVDVFVIQSHVSIVKRRLID